MHAVINHLRFAGPVDDDLFDRAERELADACRGVEGFRRFAAVETAEDHVVLVIEADDAATLDRLAQAVGNSWMSEHVAPLLAGPPERSIGEVVAEIAP